MNQSLFSTTTVGGALSAHVQGAGATVVCLHSSAASRAQWRPLADTLGARWRVVAPDLHGHGSSPDWPATAPNSLQVDADAVMRLAGIAPVHLVGHSYGAAVALQIALHHPQNVASLTLYEPVVFGMLKANPDNAAALEEIEEVAHSVAALVGVGRMLDAAHVFVAYWGGSRAWAGLGEHQRRALMGRMAVVPRQFDALFAAEWTAPLLAALQMPVLLLRGSNTRTPARRVSELLMQALPHAQSRELQGAGHLGPISHAQTVSHWMTAHVDPLLAHRYATPGALNIA